MFLLVVFLGLSFFSCDVSAGQDADLTRALELRRQYREEEALRLFEDILQKEPDNYQALLNGGYLHFRLGWLYCERGSEQQKHQFRTCSTYAERALALEPTAYQARMLKLAARAKMARFLPPGDQVRTARELYRELSALAATESEDPDLLYMLSWLNMKVGRVDPLQRMLASMLFGGLPEGLTPEKAISLMEKAISLRPGYAVYYYDLGQFRQWLGRPEEARALFTDVQAMEPDTPEEVVYRRWAGERLMELSRQDGGDTEGR